MAKEKTVVKNDAGFVVWFYNYTVKSKDGVSVVIPKFGIQYPNVITDGILMSASSDDWITEQNSGLRDLPADTILQRLNGQIIVPGTRGWDRMTLEELEAQAKRLQALIDAKKNSQ